MKNSSVLFMVAGILGVLAFLVLFTSNIPMVCTLIGMLAVFFLFWGYAQKTEWETESKPLPVSSHYFSMHTEPASGQSVQFFDADLRPIGTGVYLARGEWDIQSGTEDGAVYWMPA